MLDFVGSLVDARHTEVAIPTLDGHLAGVAHTVVNLHDAINDTIGHIRAIQLRHTCLVTVIYSLVCLPGSMEGQPLRRRDLHGRVGEHPLNSLAISDRLAKGHSLL